MSASTLPGMLAEIRQRAQMSQADLARVIHCDHSFVSRLEAGTRNPSRDHILAMSRALDLSLTDTDRILVAAGYAPITLMIPPGRRYRARMDDTYRHLLQRVWRDSREDDDERWAA